MTLRAMSPGPVPAATFPSGDPVPDSSPESNSQHFSGCSSQGTGRTTPVSAFARALTSPQTQGGTGGNVSPLPPVCSLGGLGGFSEDTVAAVTVGTLGSLLRPSFTKPRPASPSHAGRVDPVLPGSLRQARTLGWAPGSPGGQGGRAVSALGLRPPPSVGTPPAWV